jgi:hypothetical protein
MVRRGSEGVGEERGFDCTTSKVATCTLSALESIKKPVRLQFASEE